MIRDVWPDISIPRLIGVVLVVASALIVIWVGIWLFVAVFAPIGEAVS